MQNTPDSKPTDALATASPDTVAQSAQAALLWQEASRIALQPAVSEALQAFSEDSTLDNSIGVVVEVLTALLHELLTTPDGRVAPLPTIANLKRVKALADEAVEWSSERGPRDYGDAELLKAVWTYEGNYTGPCEGCDGECGEACAQSCTVEEAHAAIDQALERHKTAKAEGQRMRDQRVQALHERYQARIAELTAAASQPAQQTQTLALHVDVQAIKQQLAAYSTPAAFDVMSERQRQISAEGWTPAHDDEEHDGGELATAAACYAMGQHRIGAYILWPWNESWWKPRDRRSDLVRAGALLLAEIERLDRAAARKAEQQTSAPATAAVAHKCGMCGYEGGDFDHIGQCPRCHWDELEPSPTPDEVVASSMTKGDQTA